MDLTLLISCYVFHDDHICHLTSIGLLLSAASEVLLTVSHDKLESPRGK